MQMLTAALVKVETYSSVIHAWVVIPKALGLILRTEKFPTRKHFMCPLNKGMDWQIVAYI